MFSVILVFTIILKCSHSYYYQPRLDQIPQDAMVDVTNGLALKLLAIHNEGNTNNIAISPYGVLSVLVALGEGLQGAAVCEIQNAAVFPHDVSVIRIGVRDIHRHLKSYFIPPGNEKSDDDEGFLSGLNLSHDNVTLRREYEDVLRFYGFDSADFNYRNEDDGVTEKRTEEDELFPTTTISSDGTTISSDVITISSDVTTTDFGTTTSDTTANPLVEIITTTTSATTPPASTSTTLNEITTPEADVTTTGAISTDVTRFSDVTTLENTATTTSNEVTTTTKLEQGTETTTLSGNNSDITISTTSEISQESTVTTTTTDEISTTSNNILLDERGDITTTAPRKKRSKIDYLIARYYDDHPHGPPLSFDHNFEIMPPPDIAQKLPSLEPDDLFFLVNGKYKERNIKYMIYDTVLPFYYDPALGAAALRFPLDTPKYYLLLLLPDEPHDYKIDELLCKLRLNTDFRMSILNRLIYTRVKALIPSFTLKGYVVLTPTLQKMGIRRVFEPRQADFTPMTTDKDREDIYVTNVEQAITVTIRNYMDPVSLGSLGTSLDEKPIIFKADHPFLYFVVDSELHVILMAGKIINPLNSRIR